MVVDDSEINRDILVEMLGNEYDIIEAENGEEAVRILEEQGTNISLVLMDMVMPGMDGFALMEVMNQRRWIENIPVIAISAENMWSKVEQAYKLGVTDFIMRPFSLLVTRRRVINTLLLYKKQKHLANMVVEQMKASETQSRLMVNILGHIVEFRNGESGPHIIRVRAVTELLLKRLRQKTSAYALTDEDIARISLAAALHDIGKIGIDEKILNKKGKLTKEEFEEMKRHTLIGAQMLMDLPAYQDHPLVKTSYEICRWHHERYDGRGYPDGLVGEAIPISAQVVAMADVYDALTSQRCYKEAYSQEVALRMILNGECGTFQPLLLECLTDVAGQLEQALEDSTDPWMEDRQQGQEIVRHLNAVEGVPNERPSLLQMSCEEPEELLTSGTIEEIQFEFNANRSMLKISNWTNPQMELSREIQDPLHSPDIAKILDTDTRQMIWDAVHSTTPEHSTAHCECTIHRGGVPRRYRVIVRSLWSKDDPPQYQGVIGRLVDIHDSWTKMQALEESAGRDTLTGLLSHTYAKKLVVRRLREEPDRQFMMVVCDLDKFKPINDNLGHMFGDHVLKYVASVLRKSAGPDDIVCRIGGDEFMLFREVQGDAQEFAERLFHALSGRFEECDLNASIGVAETTAVGREYEALFLGADRALYGAKRAGRGRVCFYDDTMKDMFQRTTATEAKQHNSNSQ